MVIILREMFKMLLVTLNINFGYIIPDKVGFEAELLYYTALGNLYNN